MKNIVSTEILVPAAVAERFPIFGVDPGQTTGIAICVLEAWRPDARLNLGKIIFHLYDIDWPAQAQVLDNVFERFAPKTAVVEEFRLYPHKAMSLTGSKFPAVEVIGHLRTLALFTGTLFVEQGAAMKAAFKPVALNALGLNIKGTPHHSQDALKHILYYLVKEGRNAQKQRTSGATGSSF